MCDQTKRKDDPGCIWRDQPEEKLPVNMEQIVNRRTEELSSSTRSEILMSIGAALLLVGVVAWRLGAHERLLEFGFAAVIAWLAISLYRFRQRIWRWHPSRPDAVATTGLEYYSPHCGLDGKGEYSLPASAKRAPSYRLARCLDGVRLLAPPPSG